MEGKAEAAAKEEWRRRGREEKRGDSSRSIENCVCGLLGDRCSGAVVGTTCEKSDQDGQN